MTERARVAFVARAVALGALLGCARGASSGDTDAHTDVDTDLPPITGCPDPTDQAPTDVYCTGLYATRDPIHHAASAIAYKPGVLLWSDGAEKARFLMLPTGTTINTLDLDHWIFPVGTKAFKEFRVGGKLIETRMLWKQADTTWVTTTYIWDAAGLTATRNTSTTGVVLPDGYEIPTDKDCGKCHHGGADYLLGVEAVSLALPTAGGHTLSDFVGDGLLSDPPIDTSVTLPHDDSGHAEAALGFLHANCGMACHSTRGLGEETQLVLRLRADEFWDETGHRRALAVADTDLFRATVGQPPTTASVAQKYPGALRVTPGQHAQSLLWLLSDIRGVYQMPPLGSHKVDEPDNAELAAWIDQLPP